MTDEDYQEQIRISDSRIDQLTKPIPSRDFRRAAEAIRSAEPITNEDQEIAATYSEDDYGNLLLGYRYIKEFMPRILEGIRARSIDPQTGWQFVDVTNGNGDHGLCAICEEPFQHYQKTVKVHHLDMSPGSYYGVCRECVKEYGPEAFADDDELIQWVKQNPHVCEPKEDDNKAEGQRVDLVDAIRRHANSTHYASKIAEKAAKWAEDATDEWR
ncbi:MAG: hypothetical protein CMM00_09985 [Rhodopirellula sp.]|nr:hypothetical protein [Rhodopirellula sp.]